MFRDTLNAAVTQTKAVPGIIVIKPASVSKLDLEAMSKKVAQIVTKCCQANIEVVDIIVTFTGSKDAEKRVKTLIEQQDIEILLLYNAKQVADTEKEYRNFVADMRDWYNLKVICYR